MNYFLYKIQATGYVMQHEMVNGRVIMKFEGCG
jgi:hypothetical protein